MIYKDKLVDLAVKIFVNLLLANIVIFLMKKK